MVQFASNKLKNFFSYVNATLRDKNNNVFYEVNAIGHKFFLTVCHIKPLFFLNNH